MKSAVFIVPALSLILAAFIARLFEILCPRNPILVQQNPWKTLLLRFARTLFKFGRLIKNPRHLYKFLYFYISTFVSFFCYTCRIGLWIYQMNISLYVHYTDKNNNKISTDELYSTVHCVNIPSIFTSYQFSLKVLKHKIDLAQLSPRLSMDM